MRYPVAVHALHPLAVFYYDHGGGSSYATANGGDNLALLCEE